MINKRLLVKTLLAHNDENSFYDKKRKLNLNTKEGKAKFLKHICALSNSNPKNNSFIVIGVEDQNNRIVGVDFFDDSKLQNLINAYLNNPPSVLYENIPFPHLRHGKVVGLVTIQPNATVTALQKNIWKYSAGTIFLREGSISMPKEKDDSLTDTNAATVAVIEKHAQNNIKLTLDGVFDFMQTHGDDLIAQYRVFKETFVVCWAGLEKKVKNRTYYSRVDIELINEQVKLFYSAFDEVEIEWTPDTFVITEYVRLGIEDHFRFFPLEEVRIHFMENGSYRLQSDLLFEPPELDKKTLHHCYNANNALLDKLEKHVPLTVTEETDLLQLPASAMLCYLNSVHEAKEQLERAKPLLKLYGEHYVQNLKEALRILRKIKYN